MAQVTFGTVLRDARERKGYDLATAARRLRIRTDILHAIEANDFSRMPPRGYTRNMVNAYARLVGLNPSEMTRMYLDEAYAYQVGRARDDSSSRGSERSGSQRSSRMGHTAQQEAERLPRQNAFGRTMYDDRREYGRDYGSRNSGTGHLYSEDRPHPSRHSAVPTTQYTNFYAGPKAAGGMQSKLPFIIAGAVVLVVLIVVLAFALGNKGGGSAENTPNVPVTGLTDTTQGENGTAPATDTNTPAPAATETAPTSVKVVYKVSGDQPIYAIITTNGTAEETMLTGPDEKTVELTADSTWSIAAWASDVVSVTVDGKAAAFDTVDASGIPLCAVDFNAYLEKWYEEHPNATKKPQSTTGTDATAGTSTDTGSAANAGGTTTPQTNAAA